MADCTGFVIGWMILYIQIEQENRARKYLAISFISCLGCFPVQCDRLPTDEVPGLPLPRVGRSGRLADGHVIHLGHTSLCHL